MSAREQHIQRRLDLYLEVEFTFIDSSSLATQIAGLSDQEVEFVLSWTRRVATTQVELAHQFLRNVLPVLGRLDRNTIESWALHALDSYDRTGLRDAMGIMRDIDRFVHLERVHADGVVLDDVSSVLANFVNGLDGRRLKIDRGDEASTDGERIVLPPVAARYPTRTENFTLYKGWCVMAWAQTRFGTFRELAGYRASYPQGAADGMVEERFLMLEGYRLARRVRRELPGLYREMNQLDRLDMAVGDGPLEVALMALDEASARAADSLEWAGRLDPGQVIELPDWVPRFDAEAALAAMSERTVREKREFRLRLSTLRNEHESESQPRVDAEGFQLVEGDPDAQRVTDLELTLDGAPVSPPDRVRQLVASIRLDLGEVPPEYLVAAGPGDYDPEELRQVEPETASVWEGVYHEEGAEFYDEWDHARQHYRRNWCVMREQSVTPVYDGFASMTMERHGTLLKRLRRTFESIRDEDRLLRRQPSGENIDIDAVVEGLADSLRGREMPTGLFTRMHRDERDIAVVFMVDMSGSTRGWINDAEREALVLLCEVLETLGDRYAIYGFTSVTRKRCELYRVKSFDDSYDDETRARISGIRPQEYTRMGFAIRHLTALLGGVEARTRVLVTLSDGKPDDYSDYRGEYGIEDTRRALLEARRRGIHPYCITIDETARDYLPRMYGNAAYTVVDNVRDLPVKVSDIYRRLTT